MKPRETTMHDARGDGEGKVAPATARRPGTARLQESLRPELPGRWAREGQSTVLMVVMALTLLAVVALLYDAGNLFAARRELQNAADSAARAGADALDQRNYRRLEGQGSDAYGFGRGIAEATAGQYLAAQGITDGEIDASGRAVIVRVRRTVPTLLLHGPGEEGFTVAASAGAEPVVR